jgi:DNA-binding MarR family transcriptional regulator
MSYSSDHPEITPGQGTIDNVLATSNWLNNEISKGLTAQGITFPQYKLLCMLHDCEPKVLTCSQVGEVLMDRTPDVTRLLDRLERNELIQRKRAEHDRRIVEVHLTDKGHRTIEAARAPLERKMEQISSALSNAEHLLLVDYLERLRRDTFR